jgi:hypothetical protein
MKSPPPDQHSRVISLGTVRAARDAALKRSRKEGHVTGLSCRRFLLDHDDRLYRLPNTKFDLMLRDPQSHRWPQFAETKMRMTDVLVELQDRRAIRVFRAAFSFLVFDAEGCVDAESFQQQQWARAELALAPMAMESQETPVVVDAATRFVSQGGNWTPSEKLARLIDQAALDRIKYTRL